MKLVKFSMLVALVLMLAGAVSATAQETPQMDAQSVNVPAGPALSEGEVIILLQAKVPVEVIQKFVTTRGAGFGSNKETGRKIISAGGNVALIGTISLNQKDVAANFAPEDSKRKK